MNFLMLEHIGFLGFQWMDEKYENILICVLWKNSLDSHKSQQMTRKSTLFS